MTGNVAKGFPDVGSLRACHQTCYHFLEKAARNSMNQGPSNPSPATKTPIKSDSCESCSAFEYAPGRPTSTLINQNPQCGV